MLGLAEQATLAIELAGCTLFAGQVEHQQSTAGVRYMLRHCHKNQGSQQGSQTHQARGLLLTVKGNDCLRVRGGKVRDGVQGLANCMNTLPFGLQFTSLPSSLQQS
jgi:hypothetical protein